MSRSAVKARLAALPWRAITADEHTELEAAKGSPLTWKPSTRRPIQHTPATPTKETT